MIPAAAPATCRGWELRRMIQVLSGMRWVSAYAGTAFRLMGADIRSLLGPV